MNKIIASKFDRVLLDKTEFYEVVSIFNNTINLQSHQGTLLAITNKYGIPNSITIDLSAYKTYFSLGQLFQLTSNCLSCYKFSIELDLNKARDFTLDSSSIALDFLEEHLQYFLECSDSLGLVQILQNVSRNQINQFLYKKIKEADIMKQSLTEFCKAIVALYSAGIGSTPSIDDAILGMIIMARAYGDEVNIFIRDDNYVKTTLISRVMLLNGLDGRFADSICHLYQNNNLNEIESLVNKIGSSSGIDMLVGSYFYFKKRGGQLCLKN